MSSTVHAKILEDVLSKDKQESHKQPNR